MILTLGFLTLWTCLGTWYFLENMGYKYRKISRVRNFFEWVLLAPMSVLIILPLSLHTRYQDHKRKSKITSV